MTCNVCTNGLKYQAGTPGSFVTGTKNFKIDVIKKHESSEIHTRNLSREQASRESLEESTATKTIVIMNKAAVDKLTLLFRNAHCIAKSGRPYTDYVTLCSLDQAKRSEDWEYLYNRLILSAVCFIYS